MADGQNKSGAHCCAPWKICVEALKRDDQPAAVTARCAITLTRLARYSAVPWMSASRLLAETVTPSIADGDQLAFSAASIAGTRITPLCEAPVGATRISPDFVCATKTAVSAKREAGCRILA